jgi:ABC-2 type transport system ATP-binding protein
MAGDYAIEIRNVHKRYGTLQVLRGVNLTVPRGEAFGLLGPNGAGKSTLTHTILGLLMPDEGTIKVFDQTEIEHLSLYVGYLPERPRYHTQFTGREYLAILGKLSDLRGAQLHQRVEAVLDLVGILDAADRRIGTYSKGMLQRLGVAQAVLHEPDLLIVDEPGSGLDPGGQHAMAELLQRVRQAGHTIFLCSHQLTEVARLCDRVGVLTHGRLDRVTALDELRAQGHSVTIRVQDLPAETASRLGSLSPSIRFSRTEIVIFPVTMQLQARVLGTLLDDGVAVISVIPEADALEQFYLQAVREGTQYADGNGPDDERATLKLEALMHGDEQ